MATAKKQKNGRYQRSVKIGVDGDGKPIRKFFTATTLKEVDALVVEFKRQQEQGMDVANLDVIWLAAPTAATNPSLRNTSTRILGV